MSSFFRRHLFPHLCTTQPALWLLKSLLMPGPVAAPSSSGVRGAISILLLEESPSATSPFSKTELLLPCTVCVCLNKHLKFFCFCSFVETSVFNSFRNASGRGFFFYLTSIRNYYLACNRVSKGLDFPSLP